MSKIFVFSKEAARIRSEARAAERDVCDSHYLKEQEKMRKQHVEDRERLIKSHMKEMADKERDIDNQYDAEIRKLRAELARRGAQLKSSQDAWELFKGLLPEVKNYASVLETKATAIALERSKDLAFTREIDNDLSAMLRRVRQIEPDMEKLLSYDDTTIGIIK